jgi:hypothetical protein
MEKSVEERLKEIEIETKKLYDAIDEKDKKWYADNKNDNKPFEEYWQRVQLPEKSKIANLDREKRLIMPYEFDELPDYGDVMPLADFIQYVNDGSFIDYDGHGYYVKDNKESNIMIIPSDVKHNSVRKDFDTIVWFNR